MNSRSLILNAYSYAVLAFVMLPILVIMPMAFSDTSYLAFPPQGVSLRWFNEFFSNSRWMGAAGFSAAIASLVAVVTSLVGTMATYAMVRGGGRLASAFQTALVLPIIVPHLALAVALYLFFQKVGLTGSIWAYVLAHSVIAMPFTVFTVAAALAKMDPALENAAMSCGANRFDAFRLVTLPNILPNVLSGALFAFIISFDEPVITYFLAGARDKTLPRLMFEDIQMNITPILAAIAVLLTGLSILVLLAAAFLRHLSQRPSLATSA
ncbi:MAG: Spermidine Putrescine ABC transporter permease component potC (TC_3.A.1.11.1) [uncultured Microvirga sp.]|uniref:Spermidine Putrescine ABC transporter permease component potC (TC_3.A.1.11.1) n=1 Tax=uncultured Microvirga sp. TaxID=412392 RepID=A0A6J4KLY1_9HYPH|nr:MAG: Spermidine Putrescine ABC transporter permease component potC (TC_3.A.1.11.1) [uncultured Microvirga sp.]